MCRYTSLAFELIISFLMAFILDPDSRNGLREALYVIPILDNKYLYRMLQLVGKLKQPNKSGTGTPR